MPTTTRDATTPPPAPLLALSIDGGPVIPVGTQVPVTIGSHQSASIVVPANGIASHHLDLRCTPAGWALADLGTPGGTWLDGHRLTGPILVDRPRTVLLGGTHGWTTVHLYLATPTPAAGSATALPVARRSTRFGTSHRIVAAIFAVLAVLGAIGAVKDRTADAAVDGPSAPPATSTTSTSTTSTIPRPRTGPAAVPTEAPAMPQVGRVLEGIYRGEGDPAQMDALLTETLAQVDGYWKASFRRVDLPAPSVEHLWNPAGVATHTRCADTDRGDDTMSYCAADDTITIALPAAIDTWHGRQQANDLDWQGLTSGEGSIGFLVAHEYAHDLQWELGLSYDRTTGKALHPTIALELHADCLAGVWVNGALRSGLFDEADVQEAADTVQRFGDFDDHDEHHHGRPQDRFDAFSTGYTSGIPTACTPLLDTPAPA